MNQNAVYAQKIVVFVSLTLDGVMQSPGRPEEDPRGGFQYGGWAAGYGAMQSPEAFSALPELGPLLLGRWTYESLYHNWAHQAGNPMAESLNQVEKYVISNTLREPLPWVNSRLISGDAAEGVARLKAQPGKDIWIMGSGTLIQTLSKHNLVDRYILLIHPLVLGSGRRLFPEGSPCTSLQLIDAKKTASGVVVASYQPSVS